MTTDEEVFSFFEENGYRFTDEEKEFIVHIIGYASGSVHDTQADITSDNEGLLVELSYWRHRPPESH